MNRALVAFLAVALNPSAHAAVEVTFASTGGSVDTGTVLEVTVRSTDAQARDLSPIHLEVPSQLLMGSRPAATGSAFTDLQTSETGTTDLNAGGNLTQSVMLAPLSFRETLAPRALFFRSAELPVYSVVTYADSVGGPKTTIRQKHMTRVTGPLTGIAFGGFIGVALAVVFTWAYAKSQNKTTPPWKQQLFTLATGIFTVVIVALVRNADETLLKIFGIVIAIYDYRGGIVVGLLFQPIAKKLSEWLLGEKAPAAPVGPVPSPAGG